MRIDFNISSGDVTKFDDACEAVIRNVGRGTRRATVDAVSTILGEALAEVPIDTGTLASSIFGGTFRRSGVKGYVYGGIVGFGGQSGLSDSFASGGIEWIKEPADPINPKSGVAASTYATKVHEDLSLSHPNGGKAKFLEDPVRSYASGRFARTAVAYWKNAIELSGTGTIRGD